MVNTATRRRFYNCQFRARAVLYWYNLDFVKVGQSFIPYIRTTSRLTLRCLIYIRETPHLYAHVYVIECSPNSVREQQNWSIFLAWKFLIKQAIENQCDTNNYVSHGG